ncbi:beta-galactosidase [Humibacter albus]|uniref:beta-galactosidase n=1 Tax=Humibacter albus TaxID=427754 RepID=UPI00041AEF57|nr:beta-galactosidase [Humibacter albus]
MKKRAMLTALTAVATVAALTIAPASAVAVSAGTAASVSQAAKAAADSQVAVHFPGNDGASHKVTYDSKSIKVDGQRLTVFSGEFHYWREPSTSDWRDVFQKMRAAGFNAVSLYFFWGLHSTKPGEYDFTGIKNIDLLLTMAQQEGLYVIARPGPYVNAEISMGGLPAYLTNSGAGSLRSMDDPDVVQDQKDWLHAFDEIANKHLVTDGGGSVVLYQVENEMISDGGTGPAYMKQLTDQVKSDGIDVPLFVNDWGMGGRFAPGKAGAAGDIGVDMYGYDNYPLGFTCNAGRGQVPDNETAFRAITKDGPEFIPEGQGGAFTPWGASFNTDKCADFVDADFTRQYGVNNIANGVTLFNYYMEYGGTNWGWTGSPSSGFTSYDYGAAIDENRQLTPKLATQKEIGYYQEALPQLADMIPQTAPTVSVTGGSGSVNAYERIATEKLEATSVTGNGTRILGFRKSDSNDTSDVSFTVPLTLDAASAPVTTSYTTDDADTSAISYTGGWTHHSGTAGDYKTTESWSNGVGDSLSYTFTGTGIQIIAPQADNHGYADVYIDGEKQDTNLDTYKGQNAAYQVIAFQKDGLSDGQHTLKIVVNGQKTSGSAGSFVSIDAVNVLNANTYTTNDTDTAAITYAGASHDGKGDWEQASGKNWTAGDYHGDETFSSTPGDSVTYSFTGTGIQVISPDSVNHGKADVYIDGDKVSTIDTYASVATPQQLVFEKKGLSNGEHTIKIVVTDQKNPASEDTFFSVDAFNVLTGDAGGADSDTVSFARVPQKAGTSLTLHGRDALLVTADDKFDDHELYYTTSELVGTQQTADGDLLTLDGYQGDAGETVFHYASEPTVSTVIGSDVEHTWDAATGTLRLNYTHSDPTVVKITGGGASDLLVNITNRDAMDTTWQVTGTDGDDNATVLAAGVELLRHVNVSGDTAELTGDTKTAGTLTVYVPKGVTKLTWNGEAVATTTDAAGALVASVGGAPAAQLPTLTNWVTASDGPEASADYDDSSWTTADDTTADNTRQGPGPRQGVVLDTDHYGFYEGDTWYRAHFTPTTVPSSISLTGQGGSAANMLVWINGVYAGATSANGSAQTVTVPAGSMQAGTASVVSVLVSNSGQNLDWSDNGLSRQNRGLYDADLGSTGAVTWKIQGAKDKADPVDTARTIYNVGGLYGERAGWYLPGYPDDDWTKADSFKPAQAGVTWYRTTFDLDVPEGVDTAYALKINDAAFENGRNDYARAVIYVNGWNTGYFVGNVGPQQTFTIPRGFLNMNGSNDIAIALTTEKASQGPDSIQLVDAGTVAGGIASAENKAPAMPDAKVDASLPDTSVTPGSTVKVTASASLPKLIDGATTRTVVDWGDGSTPQTLSATKSLRMLAATDDGVSVTHEYADAGAYSPTVSVLDSVSDSVLGTTTLSLKVAADDSGTGSGDDGSGTGDTGGSGTSGSGASGSDITDPGALSTADSDLAATGSNVIEGLLAVALLLILGTAILVFRRFRRPRIQHTTEKESQQ